MATDILQELLPARAREQVGCWLVGVGLPRNACLPKADSAVIQHRKPRGRAPPLPPFAGPDASAAAGVPAPPGDAAVRGTHCSTAVAGEAVPVRSFVPEARRSCDGPADLQVLQAVYEQVAAHFSRPISEGEALPDVTG